MTLRPNTPRAKSRWAIAAGIIGLLMIASAGLSYAAVFGDSGDTPYAFELDKNPQDGSGNSADDWETLYDAGPPEVFDAAGAGAIDATLIHDEPAIDETYFAGGSSKDDIDIDTAAGDPGSGGWLYDESSSAQPKADILHAFAATYLVDHDSSAATDDHTVVYFGLDRYSNDGATFAGFWFLQEGITFGPTANNGVGDIHGNHVPGDILIITDFTQGGPVVNFNVYEWVGPGNGAINGVFNLLYAGTDCTAALTDEPACSTVNSSNQNAIWDFVPKKNLGPAQVYYPGLFLEGGIDLSAVFSGNGSTAPCFSHYVAETRASFSVDSTLSDFAAGSFNTCGSVSALKYHDKNADGDQDAGEGGLSGWRIFIDENGDEALDAGETYVDTDSNGEADFGSAVQIGDYDFCEVLKTGWLNSDPGGGTVCKTVTVGAGGDTTVKFGNYQNVDQKVLKYHDLDASGGRNGSEPYLSGWEFYIEKGANETWDDGVDSAKKTTDANGAVTFSLKPGASYKICEVLQTGWVNSDPGSGTVCKTVGPVVSQATALSDIEFGNYQNVDQKVLKYHDLDASGGRNGSEPYLSGWEFYIEKGANETWDDGVDSAKKTTDANGAVTFSLKPGASYKICEVLQTGWVNSDPGSGTVCKTVGPVVSQATALSDIEFGNYQNVDQKVLKYHDLDASGGRNGSEPYLSGWEFYIEKGANETWDDGVDSAKKTTDANGAVTFSLKPGASYKICEVLQTGWVNSDPGSGTVCKTVGPVVSQATALSDIEFGNYPQYRLIILTCSEATGELVASSVSLDGSDTTTVTSNPTGIDGDLCTIGGAAYGGLAPDDYTPTVTIPAPPTP